MYVHICEWMLLNVFLNGSLPYFLRHGVSLNLKPFQLAGLASMTLGSICLHPPPKQQGCTTAFDFDMTARDLNVGALAFTVSTLPTKPFPRSRFFFIY